MAVKRSAVGEQATPLEQLEAAATEAAPSSRSPSEAINEKHWASTRKPRAKPAGTQHAEAASNELHKACQGRAERISRMREQPRAVTRPDMCHTEISITSAMQWRRTGR